MPPPPNTFIQQEVWLLRYANQGNEVFPFSNEEPKKQTSNWKSSCWQ